MRNLALVISSIITIWIAVLFFVIIFFSFEDRWEFLLILLFLTFFILCFLIFHLLNLVDEKKGIFRYWYKRTEKDNSVELNREIKKMNLIQKNENNIDSLSDEKLQQIKELRNMEKYRRAFLGDVSHELRTPIFTIQGYISTLLDGGLEDPSINRKYLERTDKSIERMISIVEDLISISKLESGEIEINKSAFCIQDLILDIIEMQEVRAKKKNVELLFLNKKNDKTIVYADKKLIYQVLLNLIVNAITYGKKNGKVSLSILDKKENVLIEVKDQGEGIANEHLDRIFNRFYRIDKSRSREYGGTGLGLSICKHIIEAHQQKITVKSEIGKGSIFSFSLKKIRNDRSLTNKNMF